MPTDDLSKVAVTLASNTSFINAASDAPAVELSATSATIAVVAAESNADTAAHAVSIAAEANASADTKLAEVYSSQAFVAVWHNVMVDCMVWVDRAAVDGTRGIDVAPLIDGEFVTIPDWAVVREKLLNDSDPKHGADWSFWIEWYDKILRGDAQDWDMLYEIAVSQDIDWEATPREVNAAIARIVEKFQEPKLFAAKKQIEDLDAALILEKQLRAELEEQFENEKTETKEKFEALEQQLEARFQVVVAERVIEGPSKLWEKKLDEHSEKVTKAYQLFILALVVLAAFLGGIAYWLICGNATQLFLPYGCDLQFAPELCGGISLRGTMVSVLFATLLTLGFWFVRVQLKVFCLNVI